MRAFVCDRERRGGGGREIGQRQPGKKAFEDVFSCRKPLDVTAVVCKVSLTVAEVIPSAATSAVKAKPRYCV